MKIGIIGLRPHQISDIQGRNIPLELEFYTDKSVTRQKIESFANRQDKILVVVRGARSDVPGLIPSDKTVMKITGAASAVARALNDIAAANALGASLSALPPEMKAALSGQSPLASSGYRPPIRAQMGLSPMQPVSITVSPLIQPVDESKVVDKSGTPRELHCDPVDGFATTYIYPHNPETVATTYPKGNGHQSYTLLSAAIKGDILRFFRPAGLEFNTWRNRITVARNFYLRNHSVLAEAHFYVNFVDLFVLAAGSTPQSVVEDPAAREGAVPRQRDENASTPTVQYFAPNGPGQVPVKVTVLTEYDKPEDAPSLATREEAHQEARSCVGDLWGILQEGEDKCSPITPKMTDRSIRQFWQQAFLIALGQQQHPSEAAVMADQSVLELTQRYT